jgi:putative nucleotidyltransferase with HDIG domain
MSEHMNILVVDDDERILELFKEIFNTGEAYSVLTARDGVEALELCHQNKVDFCFTDLYMPRMDGIEFTRKIQRFDNTIPVVVMTGYPSTDNTISTLRNGIVDFMVKPFKIREVEFTIHKALEKKDLFVENMFQKEKVEGKRRLASLNQELSEKVNDLHTLNIILQKVDWITSSSDLFDLIVELCAKITSSDEAHFYIVDDTAGRPTRIASFCTDADGVHQDSFTSIEIETVLVERMSHDMPLLIEDCCREGLSSGRIRSLIATPLKIREKVFGILTAIVKEGSVRFTEKDLYYLSFMAKRAGFVIENLALYENIHQNLFATLCAFVQAIEAKDPYTKRHSSRVSKLALSIGKEMGCSHEELDLLNFSGHLHDIGKIGIRDSILLKPGPLTEEEHEAIKRHPVIGANIIGHVGLMSKEQKIIRHHHERWDGKGYPDGLKGESIPFLSRILAVADIYDAMASNRAYRRRVPEDVIVDIIRQNAGTKLDKEVAQGFINAYQKGEIRSNEDRK